MVKKRCQWCALTACRHITAAEISDHIYVGELGQQGWVVQLQRVARAVKLLWLMAHRLPMHTNRTHRGWRASRLVKQLLGNCCVVTRQRVGRQCRPVQLIAATAVEVGKCAPQFRCKGRPRVRQNHRVG